MEDWIAIQIARKIVDRLPKDIADELRTLIAHSAKGANDPTMDIITLLTQHENSLLWFLEQLEFLGGQGDGTRGFGSLAGNSSAAFSQTWICPKDNTESLPVIQEGEPAPLCGKHMLAMIRKKKSGG